ncbi:MAG: T9SS type A sorting domain-containing protein [Bacteroidales bacterium]|nr:T9SS type A sorting domain-containing protein [Bacteroidales bacterium]
MKIFTTFILLTVFTLSIYTQSWIGSTRLHSNNDISVIESQVDAQLNLFIFGCFEETILADNGIEASSTGGRDYFIGKFHREGYPLWIKQLGGIFDDDFNGGMVVTDDNEIIITGGFSGTLKFSMSDSIESSGMNDIFLAKYSSEGEIFWCRNIGAGADQQSATYLTIDKDGNLLLAGFFKDSISIFADTTIFSDTPSNNSFFAKISSENAELLWAKIIRSLSDDATSMIQNISIFNDQYVFTGTFRNSIVIGNDTIDSFNNSIDAILFTFSATGDLLWMRRIQGDSEEIATCISHDGDGNIYMAGHYNSLTLDLEWIDSDTTALYSNSGGYDFFMMKFDSNGVLKWISVNGGKGNDKLSSCEFYGGSLFMNGHFSNSITWGNTIINTNGIGDYDMFTGSIDKSGNYQTSTSLGGTANSIENALLTIHTNDTLYTIIRSNSTSLQIGDDHYTTLNNTFQIILGLIGCKPLSVDNVFPNSITTCHGDSTGSLQIFATGGFGSPYQYSIDNGLSYQPDISYFGDLPAGDYPVVVIDKENCAQPGPIVSIVQPDTLMLELISSSDITNDADGSIVVAASGGSSPYTYTLQPNGTVQGFGTYTFGPGDSGVYVIEVNDAQNCGPVKTDSITIQDFYGLGFEDFSSMKVRIYPNPTSGMITLEMPFEASECTLEVLSLAGQVVISLSAFTTGGMLRETIDVSDLSKGMYMLRVDGQTLRSGIVVN